MNLLKTCQTRCEKASTVLQDKIYKKLYNKSYLGKTYKRKKLKAIKEKKNLNFIKNIRIEREDKGLFVYGKNDNKKTDAHFEKGNDHGPRKLDCIKILNDESVYKNRIVLIERFALGKGKVKNIESDDLNNKQDENHKKVNLYIEKACDMNNILIKEINNYQQKNRNIDTL